MRLRPFSPKQRRVMRWWCDTSEDRGYDVIICDGAVRSGKTLCMGLSFVCWAMSRFDGRSFALCGKTIGSLRRNLQERGGAGSAGGGGIQKPRGRRRGQVS